MFLKKFKINQILVPEGERVYNTVKTMSDKQEQSWIKFLIKKKLPWEFQIFLSRWFYILTQSKDSVFIGHVIGHDKINIFPSLVIIWYGD